jgi:hypothetical protein
VRPYLLSILFASSLIACGPKDEAVATPDDSGAVDTGSTDTAADTGGRDSGGDTGSGGGGQGDVSTYEAWVQTHARTYCASLETCAYLDDQSYTDRAGCVAQIVDRLSRASCPDYDPAAGLRCVQQDRQMASACEEYPGGQPPQICRSVCEGGRESGS